MKVTASKLYSFYLALISFVALVAISINLWIVLTSIGQYYLITDDEYLQNREYYKIEQCENYWNIKWITPKTQEWEEIILTQEEIDSCIIKVTDSVSASRSYDLKEMFISSWAWFIVFLVVFLIHYPQFLKARKQD